MRNIIRLLHYFLCIVCVVLCIVSCDKNSDLGTEQNNQEETTARDEMIFDGEYLSSINPLQYGSAETSGVFANHRNDLSYNDSDFQAADAVEKIILEIVGDESVLKYEGSTTGPLYRDTVHKYSNGTIDQWFNADTGTCVYFSDLRVKEYGDTELISGEKQKEVAYDFLDSQVVNPEQFQIVQEQYISGIFTVTFSRMNNGLETCERVSLWVDQGGSVCLYKMEHIDEMSNVQPIPDEIIEKVRKSLDIEAKSIYGALESQGYTWTYEKSIDRLVRLDDGSLALECCIDATIVYPNGEAVGDGAWFIIPITEPTIQTE